MRVVGGVQEASEEEETAVWRWVVKGALEIGAMQEYIVDQL